MVQCYIMQLTPCLFPKCINPECINPDHVDFPNTAIPNPLYADDTGYTLSGVAESTAEHLGIILDNDVWENDWSGLMLFGIIAFGKKT